MIDLITKRLEIINQTLDTDNAWSQLVTFASSMKEIFDISEYKDDITITIWPLDMVGRGSISFHISSMPNDVYLKMWNNSGYYLAFFKSVDGYFDNIIRNTFNEDGIVTIDDMDDAELKILDYLTMELYKYKNKYTI
jgi:hypothetical protein